MMFFKELLDVSKDIFIMMGYLASIVLPVGVVMFGCAFAVSVLCK